MRVAFLGPQASFSHEAALKVFPKEELVAVDSIQSVFTHVSNIVVDAGIIPLENSTEGSVTSTLDALTDTKLMICAELLLDIRQCFLSNEKERGAIKRIYSHPQGFAQCRKWIEQNFPNAELVECSSTAKAAQRASKEAGCAAIASETASAKFSIALMEKNINDISSNKTRFVVLMQREAAKSFAAAHKGPKPKTSIIFAVKDKSGMLFEAIKSFKEFGVNMTKIESRPSKRNPWEYIFFVDLDGMVGEGKIDSALLELNNHCEFVKILGSYYRIE
ncbi:Prephenate dehydratase [uncultured archaeon]|nr:Prephenate dehydratase [uncultured archaeon]